MSFEQALEVIHSVVARVPLNMEDNTTLREALKRLQAEIAPKDESPRPRTEKVVK